MATKTSHSTASTKKKAPLRSESENLTGMDIIEAIKQDHKDLKTLLKVMKDEDSTIAQKDSAYKKFSALLKSHASSEEKALYAKCIDEKGMSVETNEAYVEHELAALLMKSIEATDENDRRAAQIQVLAENVEHHIDEEENDFLPDVKKEFDKNERIKMAQEFLRLRKNSQKETGKQYSGVLAESLH
jgi:hemerythrin-like domain-containing protein